MIIFLIISFILIMINFFTIGIIFSKISLDVTNCNIYSNSLPESIVVDRMKISINLYLYKFIKVVTIKFYDKYLKIGFIKIYYQIIFDHKKEIINKTTDLIKLLLGKNRLTLNILEVDIENFYMNMSLCSKDAALTSMLTTLISNFTSFTLSKLVKKYEKDKYFYKIVPVYFDINGFKIDIKTKINFNTLYVLEFLYDYYLVKNNK